MKPFTYLISKLCKYKKIKTMTIKKISKLLPTYNLMNANGEIVFEEGEGRL